MSHVIRISKDLYQRLEVHASGFDTPSNVIERLLNEYEGVIEPSAISENSSDIEPATSLVIFYDLGSEEKFKEKLLIIKKAHIKLYYTNGVTELKEWNASRFKESSRLDTNLRSGYLRGWKVRGIFKAELMFKQSDIL